MRSKTWVDRAVWVVLWLAVAVQVVAVVGVVVFSFWLAGDPGR